MLYEVITCIIIAVTNKDIFAVFHGERITGKISMRWSICRVEGPGFSQFSGGIFFAQQQVGTGSAACFPAKMHEENA